AERSTTSTSLKFVIKMRQQHWRLTLIVMLLASAPALASADPIFVADVQFEIPAPRGFIEATSEMKLLAQLLKEMESPQYQRFAAFVSQKDADFVQDQEGTEITRVFAVEVPKPLIGALTSWSEFQKIKQTIRAEAAMPNNHTLEKIVEKVNQELSNRDLDPRASSIKLFPIHHESDRGFSYSMNLGYLRKDKFGESFSFTRPATLTVICIKSKVLFLHVSGDDGDLEWTRHSSKQWADAVMAANQPDLRTTVRDFWAEDLPRLNWLKLLRTGMLVFLILGFIWIAYKLPGWLRKRVQQEPQKISTAEIDPKENN
ncbi:MAG: hypothetical protein JWN70_1509, partial [Planctomycetaceae bacterium]|nr:hypothetical protein [Planctomycetaceae bacterium]